MKPATYNETVLIVRAWCGGNLKVFLVEHHMTHDCARQRVSRFRKAFPVEYKRLCKMSHLVTSQKGRRGVYYST
jgi:hypothetical protein